MGTKIEWTNASWSPVIGCSKVSPGCQNCYAERMAARLANMDIPGYCDGVVELDEERDIFIPKWTGKIVMLPHVLEIPLHWRKPRMIFVCSMSDLFHPSVPFEFIDKVVNVFEKCPRHTGQFLTKREKRLYEYSKYRDFEWPSNIIGMVTAENQPMADLRIPYLLLCGFKTTGVSIEPMLGEVNLIHFNTDLWWCPTCEKFSYPKEYEERDNDGGYPQGICPNCGHSFTNHLLAYYEYEYFMESDKEIAIKRNINWVIVGGESGPGARFCPIKNIYSVVDQCDSTGVPIFVKQIHLGLYDKFRLSKKMAEWPEDLRIRQYPEAK